MPEGTDKNIYNNELEPDLCIYADSAFNTLAATPVILHIQV